MPSSAASCEARFRQPTLPVFGALKNPVSGPGGALENLARTQTGAALVAVRLRLKRNLRLPQQEQMQTDIEGGKQAGNESEAGRS